jgi:hypothetical protein
MAAPRYNPTKGGPMPRVHKQVAGKDYPSAGITKGETYYKWKFRYGGVRRSLTPPRPSQLTMSRWGDILAAQEAIGDADSWDETRAAVEAAAETVRECADEYEAAAEPFGGAGDNQERADHCQELADELDNLLYQFDEDVPCASCNDGQTTCSDCDGTGEAGVCDDCDGRGNLDCDECGGTGMEDGDPDAEDDCNECSGGGATDCDTCDGNGTAACEQCDREGEHECGTCMGNGMVPPNSEGAPEESSEVESRLEELRDLADALEWDSPV